MFFQRTNLAQQLRVLSSTVTSNFTNTSATTALHSMNPTPHPNNDLSSLSNELHDLIDAHLATLTQQHVAFVDTSHPHSLLRQILHQQFKEDHLKLQLHNLRLRQYTTHQQPLIHQFVGNSPPHYPNTTRTNSNPNPDPNPDSNQRGGDSIFATQSEKGAHVASFTPGTSAIFKSKASLTNSKAFTLSTTRKPTSTPLTPRLPQNEHCS